MIDEKLRSDMDRRGRRSRSDSRRRERRRNSRSPSWSPRARSRSPAQKEINFNNSRIDLLQCGQVLQDSQVVWWHMSHGDLELIVRAQELKEGKWLEIRGWDQRYMGQHIRVFVTEVGDEFVKAG
eukprot:g13992.t1